MSHNPIPPSAAQAPTDAVDAPDHAPDNALHQRPIRSFVLRQGRLTTGQQKALDTLMPQYGVAYVTEPLALDQLFGRADSLKILEIGFGMGETSAAIAAAQPQHDFIGVEVHVPGVGALLKRIGEQRLTNLRIVQHDAVEVLQQMIAPAALAGVHVYFPDPWHKKRHHKRRLIQPAFAALLASRIAPGGYLHCATDWQDYAEQMLQVLSAEPLLHNTTAGYAPRPAWRPQTKFEARGLKLGHGVWDLLFKK